MNNMDSAPRCEADTARSHSRSESDVRAGEKDGVETVWRHQYKSDEHASFYATKRDSSLMRRLSNHFELSMVRRSLRRIQSRHSFRSVLDCASGTGRFMPLLAEFGVNVVALDTSKEMLEQGRRHHGLFRSRPKVIVASADDLPLPNESVDVVFCSRLLHHLPESGSRVRVLQEFARVARFGVVITFFDAFSYRSWRRSRKKQKPGKLYGRHGITRAQCAGEGRLAGLTLIGMNSLLRFHTEVTAAAFMKDGLEES